jgi:hypothetical protein
MSKYSKSGQLTWYDVKNIWIYIVILFSPVIILMLEQLQRGWELNYDVIFTAIISTMLIAFKKFITDYTKNG